MAHPSPAGSVGELLRSLEDSLHLDDGRLEIDDEAAFRGRGVRQAIWSATFSEERDVIEAARWLIWQASQALGAPSWSIQDLYMARGRGELGGFTVPAVNIRTQVFDMAAAMCRAAQSLDAGAIIFELARSEQEYTYQRPGEYVTGVLAGCISAGWQGPVFVQGDHYQFNAKKYAADPEGTTEALRRLTREAIEVGYGNIDIDSSTLVDLSKPTVDEQQRVNYQRAAELAALIRQHEPDGLTISIGGEIGEVGKQNSTEEELRVYLDGFRRELDRLAGPGAPGLSKVSVQTGTSHGGVPLPGGGVAEVKLDFDTLARLSAVCREYGMAGAVQHGASTLPDELFDRFPQAEAAEIHLATGFQNALYEHPAFPAELLREIEGWCYANTADERKEGETDTQFLYKTRKKALGPHKRELWELSTKDEIMAAQEAKFRFLFERLGVAGSRALVERHVPLQPRPRPAPDGLLAAAAGR
ncbi:MAG TPA: class II fructose-bisphosphate aldolase [Candidatus Limnocylindria bacterium]|nr:class II fructose-bisphosphate aldolase [Candidatus Limnocylindria bacterium]